MYDEVESPVPRDHSASQAAAPRNWLAEQLDRAETGSCRVDLLLPAYSPRQNGEVDEHVRLLAESAAPLPPIIVHRPTMRVVDGMHRLRAAVLRGSTEIEVRWYDGEERDAFALAVHTNVAHGLPLSLADRRKAATRIIESHPHWSDRMIASIVNLVPPTVRAIRATTGTTPSTVRLGLDGRTRPVNTAAGRRLAGELLRDNPDASIREIARSTGLAPATVLDVRRRILEGADPVPPKQLRGHIDDSEPVSVPAKSRPRSVDPARVLLELKKDPSLRFTDVGRMLLRWLEIGLTDADTRARMVDQLPPHCLAGVATLAHDVAAAWQELAGQLAERGRGTSSAM